MTHKLTSFSGSSDEQPRDTHARGFLRLGSFLGVLSFTVLIPILGVVYPLLTDLPHHVLVNKLVWEKISGTSNLDLEMSWYLGYRLPTVIMVPMIGLLSIAGISLVFLPKMFAAVLMTIHSVTAGCTAYLEQEKRDLRSLVTTACFVLPSVVFMYSACWFMGFIGYTLAITLLIPAIFFTEHFLVSGKAKMASFLFLALILVYLAHPFAITFWLIWCLGRFLASIITLGIVVEWKRFPLLGLILVPIVLYHAVATAGAGMPSSSDQLFAESLFQSYEEWYKNRFAAVIAGEYFRTDETGGSLIVSYGAIAIIVLSLIVGLVIPRDPSSRRIAISVIFFAVFSSWISEKFFPVPAGHWLAYDYRFVSTAFVVCLAAAAVIFIRSFQRSSGHHAANIIFIPIALLCAAISLMHIALVASGNSRFDLAARDYMNAVFERQSTASMTLPKSRWYPDANFLRRYGCLKTPDCNPAGTLFRNLPGDVYPITTRSDRFAMPPPEDRVRPPGNAFVGGDGYFGGQFARPRGIATDILGNVYVADTGNRRIQKFTSNGEYLLEFGRTGDQPGQFKEPTGVAVDRIGLIYAADSFRNVILRFNPDGSFDKEWTASENKFMTPLDLAFGGDGLLYILDVGQGKILRFDPVKQEFTVFGGPPPENQRMNRPTGIDAAGEYVFVADSGNNQIQIYGIDGTFIRSWPVKAWAGYVWHYPDVAYEKDLQIVYVSSGWSKEVMAFTLDGHPVGSYKLDPPTELRNVCSLALSPEKKIFALNMGSDIVDNGDPMVTLFDLRTQPKPSGLAK